MFSANVDPAHAASGPATGRVDVSGRAGTTYSSNVFREKRRSMGDFDAKSAPGERYHRMASPDDFILAAGLGLDYARRVGDRRDIKLGVDADYARYLRTPIASHFTLGAGVSYEITKADRVSLKLQAVPHRFKKNYAAQVMAGNKVYEAAYYRELEPRLGYRRRWGESWRSDLVAALGLRRHLGPFGNRDRTWGEWGVLIGHELGRKVDVGLGGRFNITKTPSGRELGVVMERSFQEWAALATMELRLPGHTTAGAQAEYRQRHYTTDVILNDGYFERSDQRIAIGIEASKRVGKGIAVLLHAEWMTNATDRADPKVDTDELGYDVLAAGLGVRGTF